MFGSWRAGDLMKEARVERAHVENQMCDLNEAWLFFAAVSLTSKLSVLLVLAIMICSNPRLP